MEIDIREVKIVTDELSESVNALIRQLSTSAAPVARDELEALAAAEGTTLLAAYVDQELVGMLALIIFVIPTGKRALIEDVVVHDQWRGHGIGRALATEAVSRARAARVRTVDLTSSPKRVEANELYQKLGFQPRVTNVYRLH